MAVRGTSARRWVPLALLGLVLPLGPALVLAPPADAASTVTIAATGDHTASSYARAVLRSIGAAHPDVALSLGDLTYDQVTTAAWCQLAKDELNAGAGLPAGSAYGETFPLAITQGNHDVVGFDDVIAPSCLPDRLGSTPAPASTYGRDYYVDVPAGAPLVRMIVASPGLGTANYRAGAPALQWLSDTIDAGRAAGIPWVVVANHLDYISSGSKGDEIGSAFFDLLVDKQVDLVLQAHEHSYQRSKQLRHNSACPTITTGTVDPDCIADDGADGLYQAGAGPVLVINGTGGAPLYPIASSDPEAGYFAVARGIEAGNLFGWSKITASDTTLSVSFQSAGVAFSDGFAITRGDPPPPDQTPPSAPTGVTASAVAARVDVAWSPATDDRGITGYQVWRDGVQLATVVTTSYADTGAQPGRTYSYTVRAVDAAGNVSPDSAPSSVTTPASSSVIYAETFPGADGTAWPAPWTTSTGSGGVAETRGGAGTLGVAAATTGSFARAVLSAGDAVADADLLTRFRWSTTAATSYASLWLRGSGGWLNGYRPVNGYGVQLTSTSTTVAVQRAASGAVTTIALPVAIARTTAPQWVRFQAEGSSLRLRTWLDGAPEPTTWQWTGTDTVVTAPGRLHISLNRGSSSTVAQTASLDDLALSAPGPVGPAPDTTPPSSPTSVSAVAEADEVETVIAWQPSTDDVGVVGYEVLRDGVPLVGTTTGSPWFDVTVTAGQTYTYAVRAFDAAGNRSAPSASTTVTVPVPVPPDTQAPTSPTGLSAVAASPRRVDLSWTASTDDTGVTAYDVLRDGSLLLTVAGTAASDTTATPGTAYSYAVVARDAAGNASAPSSTAEVTTPTGDTTAPSAPTGLTATATSGTSVALGWQAATDDTGVTEYDVLRDGSPLATVAGTSYLDTTAAPATSYSYTVVARDAAGNSSTASAAALVTTPDTLPPTTPTGVSAVATSGTSVSLTWTASVDNVAVTAYDVLRDGTLLASTATTGWTDTTVVPGTTYEYAVRARDAAGNASTASATRSVTTPSPVAELYRDSWTLPDGSPWAAAWTSSAVGGTVTAAAGSGQLAVPATRDNFARSQLTGVAPVVGSDVTFSYRWSSSAPGGYLNIYLRGSGGWANGYRPRTGYGLELSSNSTSATLRRVVNGTVATLASVSAAQQTGTAVQRVRLQASGSTIRVRTWLASQPEPTTWRSTVTDATVGTAGQLFVSLVSGSATNASRTVALDDLVVVPLP